MQLWNSVPDAQDAQKQLDQFVAGLEARLNKMQDEWRKSSTSTISVNLLWRNNAADAERELRDMDQKIVISRTQKFGQNGELFNKQNELMKPVQRSRIQSSTGCRTWRWVWYVFDKSGDILLMYANEKYDLHKKKFLRNQGAHNISSVTQIIQPTYDHHEIGEWLDGEIVAVILRVSRRIDRVAKLKKQLPQSYFFG